MLNNNQLDLLTRKLDEIIAKNKVTSLGQNRIRVGSTEFNFTSLQPTQTLNQRTVTSR